MTVSSGGWAAPLSAEPPRMSSTVWALLPMAAHHSKAAVDRLEVGTRLSESTSVLKVKRQLRNFFWKTNVKGFHVLMG